MFGIGNGAVSGILILIIYIFIILSAIMAIFIPFWIYRIRNEAIRANRRLDVIVDLLGGKSKQIDRLAIGSRSKPTKTCLRCQTENRMEDTNCISCGSILP